MKVGSAMLGKLAKRAVALARSPGALRPDGAARVNELEPEPTLKRFELPDGPLKRDFLSALSHELEQRGVRCVRGGKTSGLRERLHFFSGDLAEVAEAVANASRVCDLPVTFREARGRLRDINSLKRRMAEVEFDRLDIWIPEKAANPVHFCTVVELDFWRDNSSARLGSRFAEAPRSNDIVNRVPWPDFEEILGAPGDLTPTLEMRDSRPNLYGVDFPIDIVLNWFDDQDPIWRSARAQLSGETLQASGTDEDHESGSPRRRWESLRYTLRSIEMYAPFVRDIYLVTDNEVPDWLDLDNTRIHLVRHRDIFSDTDALPTFNPLAVETQLHHIEGLSEHFLMFTTGMFLAKPCSWNHFFLANGVIKYFPSGQSVSVDIIKTPDEAFSTDLNSARLLASKLDRMVHQTMQRVPQPARRSVIQEMEHSFSAELQACSREQLLSSRDVRFLSLMLPHYAFHHRYGVPARMDYKYTALRRSDAADQFAAILENRSAQAFYIDDFGLNRIQEAERVSWMTDFLSKYFPYPSTFEY